MTLKITIPAGEAKMTPPLGVILGQHQMPGAKICLEFNKQTSAVLPGVPLRTEIKKTGQAAFELKIKNPPLPFLIVQQLLANSYSIKLESFFDVFVLCRKLPDFVDFDDITLAKFLFSTLKSTRCTQIIF